MKKYLLPFFLFIFNIVLPAQVYDSYIAFMPHAFQLNSLSWSGYSTLTGEASNINSINPASISQYNKISLGAAYQFESFSEDAWIAQIGVKRMYTALPQSAGIIFPIGNFKLSAGMDQHYNSRLDLGKIPVTTIQNPDGTGEYFEPIDKTNINRYSAAVAYSFNELFTEKSSLSLGIRLSYYHISQYESFYYLEADETFSGYSFSLGLTYKANNENGSLLAGLSYESGIDERKSFNIRISDSSKIHPVQTGNYDNISYIIDTRRTARCYTPGSINAGILLSNNKNMSLSGNFSYIIWNEDIYYKSEPRISASFIYDFAKLYHVSAGFLYSPIRSEKNEMIYDFKSKISALYITAGVKIDIPYFDISASVADSHLTGGEWRKHTVAKISLGYRF